MHESTGTSGGNKKEKYPPDSRFGRISVSFFRQLWTILSRHEGPGTPPTPDSRSGAGRRTKTKTGKPVWLFILSLIPWFLAGLFILSFFWDFHHLNLILFGFSYSLEGLIRFVSVSGLIGFLTNWLAITMLFRPAKKRPILGHGLIPAHKERIANRLAAAVSEDLINPEIIKKKILQSGAISRYRMEAANYVRQITGSPEFRNDLKLWLVRYIDALISDPEVKSMIAEKITAELDEAFKEQLLEQIAFKAYSFIKGQQLQKVIGKSLDQLPSAVERELHRIDIFLDRLPVHLENESEQIEEMLTVLLHRLVNKLDVYTLVEENLKEYDEGQLETLIKESTNEQLSYIQYLGAALGTVGGLVIWQPALTLSVLALLTAAVLLADKMLMQLRKKKLPA